MIDPEKLPLQTLDEAAKAVPEEKKESLVAQTADIAGNVMVEGVGEMVLGAAGAVIEGAGALVGGAAEIAGSILGGILDA